MAESCALSLRFGLWSSNGFSPPPIQFTWITVAVVLSQIPFDAPMPWRDNDLTMPVVAFGLHSSDCLKRQIDGARFLPGSVELENIPLGFPRDFAAAAAPPYHVPSSVVCRLVTVMRLPQRAT